MPQNYQVDCLLFGKYHRGSVVPSYVVEVGNNVAELLERGVLSLTDDPVNVEIAPPVVAEPAAPDSVYDEVNRLLKENASLLADNKILAGHVEGLEAQKDALTKQLGEYVQENGRLATLLQERTAELEQLTAPPEPPKE
jgi:septal ring factor EnvC (AmiA/AmiB activator)